VAILATQAVAPGGLDPVYVAAAAGGDKINPGPTTFLHVKNASGGALTVTVDSVAPCNQGADHNLVVSVPAADDRMIGPLVAERFASATDGLVAITYSGVTSLTVAAIAQ
jgi:hypothetical protein